ncbi:hypothetical protein BDD12DRAFT_800092 [Trichophaea hybrida]|nr:hypothetical protein BDD12DRAFT_800092 [Trichophaea hybrida]
MTGFEIVGVVLGSIPLLISALEHYSEGLSTMNDMREYESVFENLLTAFDTGLAIYRNSCEELLSPLSLPDNKFNDLLENRSDAWEDSELEMSLKERLGRDYRTYKCAIRRLDKKIILFGEKLKLGKDMRPPWIMENDTINEKIRNKFFNSFWTRISGGFNSDKYAKLLDQILRDIDQINKLTEGAIQNESLRREKKRQANDTYWISLQDHAKRLYQSLTTRTRSCLGLLDDQHSQHLIYCGSQPCPQNEIRKPASLEEILNCGGAVSLATKQKCTLALTLASAVLQLHNTPWMNESWDLKDIYSTQSTHSSTMVDVTCLLKNKMVFALGVALLEMSYGKHILSLKTAEDPEPQGYDSLLTKIYIANRLVGEIGARESKNYADAARRCIHCCFDTSHFDLDSKEFRDLFYQGVVLPLQRDYDFIHGINHDGQTLHDVRGCKGRVLTEAPSLR